MLTGIVKIVIFEALGVQTLTGIVKVEIFEVLGVQTLTGIVKIVILKVLGFQTLTGIVKIMIFEVLGVQTLTGIVKIVTFEVLSFQTLTNSREGVRTRPSGLAAHRQAGPTRAPRNFSLNEAVQETLLQVHFGAELVRGRQFAISFQSM